MKNSELIEEVLESSANYVLVKLKKSKCKEFPELLKPYKIMVKDCSNFDYLDSRFVRIAVKATLQMKLTKGTKQKYVNK